MAVSYKKLWKLLIDKEMNRSMLVTAAKVSPTTIAKLGKGEPVSIKILSRICDVLGCDIEDVMEKIPDEQR